MCCVGVMLLQFRAVSFSCFVVLTLFECGNGVDGEANGLAIFLCGAVLPARVCDSIDRIVIQFVLYTYVSIDLCVCVYVITISIHVCMCVCMSHRVLICLQGMHLQLSVSSCY